MRFYVSVSTNTWMAMVSVSLNGRIVFLICCRSTRGGFRLLHGAKRSAKFAKKSARENPGTGTFEWAGEHRIARRREGNLRGGVRQRSKTFRFVLRESSALSRTIR